MCTLLLHDITGSEFLGTGVVQFTWSLGDFHVCTLEEIQPVTFNPETQHIKLIMHTFIITIIVHNNYTNLLSNL